MICIITNINANTIDVFFAIMIGMAKLLPYILKIKKQTKQRERGDPRKPKRWRRCFEFKMEPGFIKTQNRRKRFLLRWECNERSNTEKEKDSHHSPSKTYLRLSFSVDKWD